PAIYTLSLHDALPICRVDDETGVANTVTDGLCRHADHFADGRHAGRSEFDVGQAHLLDQPLRVDQGEPPLRIVGWGEVGPWRPLDRKSTRLNSSHRTI